MAYPISKSELLGRSIRLPWPPTSRKAVLLFEDRSRVAGELLHPGRSPIVNEASHIGGAYFHATVSMAPHLSRDSLIKYSRKLLLGVWRQAES